MPKLDDYFKNNFWQWVPLRRRRGTYSTVMPRLGMVWIEPSPPFQSLPTQLSPCKKSLFSQQMKLGELPGIPIECDRALTATLAVTSSQQTI